MADESDHERAERLTVEALRRDEVIAALVADVENLNRKAETAAVIEQAKGVLMGGMGCGPDAAFAILVTQSQMQNRKLWEIATELVRDQDNYRDRPGPVAT